jgi:hypothetical protein
MFILAERPSKMSTTLIELSRNSNFPIRTLIDLGQDLRYSRRRFSKSNYSHVTSGFHVALGPPDSDITDPVVIEAAYKAAAERLRRGWKDGETHFSSEKQRERVQ